MRISASIDPNRPRFGDTSGQAQAPERVAPDVRNGDAALALVEFRALEFRGRAYRVPPISWADGFELQRLQYNFITNSQKQTITEDVLSAYESDVRRVVAIAGRLLIPLGWRCWLWRAHIRPNPAKGATEKELVGLLDFFLKCRTSAGVRLQIVTDPQQKST